jgi:hypothetical protein
MYRYLFIDIYVNLNRLKIFGPCRYLLYLQISMQCSNSQMYKDIIVRPMIS